MRNVYILLFLLVGYKSFSQLPNGSIAPDFTVTDLNGQSYNLYSKMGSNKAACLHFAATWCAYCWGVHQDHIYADLYNNFPSEVTVLFLEADFATNTPCLYGPNNCNKSTQGNWVEGSPFQMCDLSASNGPNVKDNFGVTYYPTLFAISPDKRIWEVKTRTYDSFVSWLTKSFKLSATATVSHCNCGDNGKIELDVKEGYGNLSYKWSNGATTKDLNLIAAGTYSVTISDENTFFKKFGPWTIQAAPKKVDVSKLEISHVQCYNESNGKIDLDVSYGTPPYQYNWSNGSSTEDLNSLKAGIYNLTITDIVGCSRTKSYTVQQPNDLFLSTSGTKDECEQHNGSILAKANGGVAPYVYDIGNGPQTASLFSNLSGAKDYTVTVTDNNACTEISKVSIEQTKKPKAEAGDSIALDCKQDSLALNANASSRGVNFNYLWTNADNKPIRNKESLIPYIFEPGIYNLKVLDLINGCISEDSVYILNNRIYPDISVKGDLVLNCKTNSIELSGMSRSDSIRIHWNKLEDSLFYKSESKISVSSPGTYIFNVLDTTNSCFSRDTLSIISDQKIPEVITELKQELSCKILETTIDAGASSQGPEFEFVWITADGNILRGENTLQPLINKAGNYLLQIKNTRNFCSNEKSTTVHQKSIPIAGFSQSILDHTVFFINESSGFPDTYKWTFGDGSVSDIQNPIHVYPDYGEYTVCLEIENDCGTNLFCRKINLGVSGLLTIRSFDIQNIKCYGDSTGSISISMEGGSPPYNYLWNTFQTTKDLTNVPAGTYSVKITDQLNNTVEKEFIIHQAEELKIDKIEITHATSGQATGSIHLELTGGTAPFQYNWSNGMLVNPISLLDPGEYITTITDANACVKQIGPFVLKELTALNYTDEIKQFSCTPNPANGKGSIHLDLKNAQYLQLNLLNLFGQSIWNRKLTAKHLTIELETSELPKGLYFVELHVAQTKKTIKWLLL